MRCVLLWIRPFIENICQVSLCTICWYYCCRSLLLKNLLSNEENEQKHRKSQKRRSEEAEARTGRVPQEGNLKAWPEDEQVFREMPKEERETNTRRCKDCAGHITILCMFLVSPNTSQGSRRQELILAHHGTRHKIGFQLILVNWQIKRKVFIGTYVFNKVS